MMRIPEYKIMQEVEYQRKADQDNSERNLPIENLFHL